MPNSTQLFECEKGQIIAYRKYIMNGHEIARKINWSQTVIYNFLKNPKAYGKKKSTGRPPTLAMCQKCTIAHWACFEKQSSTQIKIEMNLLCTCQAMYNVL